MFYFTCNHV